ncbi:MAG: hypothetical protein KDM91_17770 [Verrucomicrobiae bacterium]|nr:hypothetical protein [Verrucomicrobiae bacterium]MCP5540488.1 hypothetical protein [Akkermansiaceae bacterium]MCP5550753.1 hypothetical protein [Akkermansiaceae bacterium]
MISRNIPKTRIVLCLATLALASAFARETGEKIEPGKRGVIRFDESPIQSGDGEQVRHRLSAVEDPPPYDVKNETFEILLPPAHDAKKPHGVLIWISPGDAPTIPADWEKVLAERDIIFIGARRSGNKRNIFDRIRLAIDANHNLRQRYNIDGRRVYVSGFSGGGRVASMLGVAWADMFSGTACFMGVNFYTDIEAEDGKVHGLNYLPDETVTEVAQQACRYVLVTAEKDFNRANTRGVYEKGFVFEGFEHVKLLEVPKHGHSPPPAEWLGKALDFLDEGKR